MKARTNFIAIANDIGASDRALALPEEKFLPGIGLAVLCIAYADRQRTDGRIPANAMTRVIAPGVDVEAIIADLVQAGWLIQTDDGWEVVDYLEWQRSKAEIETAIEQRRAAGAKGGKAPRKTLETSTDKTDKTESSALHEPLSDSLNAPPSTSLRDTSGSAPRSPGHRVKRVSCPKCGGTGLRFDQATGEDSDIVCPECVGGRWVEE